MMKKSLKPLVTIGIPTFNRGSLLADTLQSAIEQDYPNIEIIISDNASSDQTENICTRLQQKHSNIIYVRHNSNMGATNNFNFVLQQAKGEYFMWLGDDDWIDKNYITECTNMLIAHPDITLTAGIPKYYYGDTYLYTGLVMNIENNLPNRRVSDYFSLVQHNGIFYSVMRTQQIQKNSLKNVIGGDLLAIASMVFMGKAYTLETTCLHRRRGGCSVDGKALAKSMQLPWLDQFFPRLSIAYNIFQHIMLDNTFASQPKVQRYMLSIKCIARAFYRKLLTILFKHRFVERAGIPNIENRH